MGFWFWMCCIWALSATFLGGMLFGYRQCRQDEMFQMRWEAEQDEKETAVENRNSYWWNDGVPPSFGNN